jgi:hypothetical protein
LYWTEYFCDVCVCAPWENSQQARQLSIKLIWIAIIIELNSNCSVPSPSSYKDGVRSFLIMWERERKRKKKERQRSTSPWKNFISSDISYRNIPFNLLQLLFFSNWSITLLATK